MSDHGGHAETHDHEQEAADQIDGGGSGLRWIGLTAGQD
jgi:hypothetical protein